MANNTMKMIIELQLELPIEHGMQSGYVEPFLTLPWRCIKLPAFWEFLATNRYGGTLRLQAASYEEAEAIATILVRKSGQPVRDWQDDDEEQEGGDSYHASLSAG